MKKIIFFVFVIAGPNSMSQNVVNKYMEFIYGEKISMVSDYKAEPVLGDIKVSPLKPLRIRTPKKGERVKVFMGNKLFENENYEAFIEESTSPFQPFLKTYKNGDSIQIDELKLLGNFRIRENNEEVIEEAKIGSETDIVLKTTTHRWILMDDVKRDKKSMRTSATVNKYKITDEGKIVIIED
jgi:ribosomal protein L21E